MAGWPAARARFVWDGCKSCKRAREIAAVTNLLLVLHKSSNRTLECIETSPHCPAWLLTCYESRDTPPGSGVLEHDIPWLNCVIKLTRLTLCEPMRLPRWGAAHAAGFSDRTPGQDACNSIEWVMLYGVSCQRAFMYVLRASVAVISPPLYNNDIEVMPEV
jgi:hypothetical protein